jgi:hypothetical protein
MKIEDAYKVLQTVGERDSKADDVDLSSLAGTASWQTLKESVINPKIAGLLLQVEDLTDVMTGKETKEQYAERAIIARIVAGHLQDIINKVEGTKEYFDKENLKAKNETAEG